MKDDVLLVVRVLRLEVTMNHIGLNDEDIPDSSVGSFQCMTSGKHVGSLP